MLTTAEAKSVAKSEIALKGPKPKADCVSRTDETAIEQALGIGQLQVYGGKVSGGFGVALVNVDTLDSSSAITVTWAMLGLAPSAQMAVRDVWARKDLGTFTGKFTAQVAAHDTALLRLAPPGAGAVGG